MPKIREARDAEAAELAAIQERASVAALAHIFPPERYAFPRAAVLERWQAALRDPGATVLVAEDETIAGVTCARRDWLDGLYVEPARWRSGVGGVLHDRALEAVSSRGFTQCHLWVLEDNERARRFYERRGWQENAATRVVPFPPHPIDVGYTKELR